MGAFFVTGIPVSGLPTNFKRPAAGGPLNIGPGRLSMPMCYAIWRPRQILEPFLGFFGVWPVNRRNQPFLM